MNGYQRAYESVSELKYNLLREAYQKEGKVKIDVVYKQLTDQVLRILCRGFSYAQNPKMEEYAQKLRESLREEMTSSVLGILRSMPPREAKIKAMRFGLADQSTLAALDESFATTRERIHRIESKALRKLRHPSRSRKLKAFLEGS